MQQAAPTRSRRWQFGLRGLLTVVTMLAIATAWIAYLNRNANERTRLTAELVANGILVDLEEPNWLGQLTKKFAPDRESWLRERLGTGWLGYPAVFCTNDLSAEQVPLAASRLRRLGTVREFQFRSEPLPSVVTMMRRELPGVDVVTPSTANNTYSQRRAAQSIFAFEGVAVLAMLAIGVIGSAATIAWKCRSTSRK